MPRALRSLAATAALLLFLMPCTTPGGAHIEPPPGNTDRTYLALRDVTTGDQVLEVSNLVLTRDASVFTLKSGYLIPLAPVQGKVTGAYFWEKERSRSCLPSSPNAATCSSSPESSASMRSSPRRSSVLPTT